MALNQQEDVIMTPRMETNTRTFLPWQSSKFLMLLLKRDIFSHIGSHFGLRLPYEVYE